VRTVDRAIIRAPLDRVFAVAVDVEQWPRFLGHYRWVRVLERRPPQAAVVEMAAWRPFGPVGWPTWWISEMTPDPARGRIRYRHVGGLTRGMDVEWRFEGGNGEVHVEIVHEWSGPRWPLIGRFAADWVIGPVFIHGIASRTLAGVRREAEQ
jgi:uncharacterized membrane protein